MITGIYAGLCGAMLIVLYLNVSKRRLTAKIGIGDGADAELERRIRIHGNFVESVPMALILLSLFEYAGGEQAYVHSLGLLLLLSRVAHAYGLMRTSGRSWGRMLGSLGNLITIGGLSIAVIEQALG
jgi:uncharacterized membrane protein YecN with MAPEG domain